MMISKYERLLKQQVVKAKYKFSLGALIINNGQLVGAGYNRVYQIGKTKRTDCAEILALKKTPKSRRKNSIIAVARLRKDGTYGIAKPCNNCKKALSKAGIKKAYYTLNDNWEEMAL